MPFTSVFSIDPPRPGAAVRRGVVRSLALFAALAIAACGETTGLDERASGLVSDVGSAPSNSTVDPESCDGTVGAIEVEIVEVPDGERCVLEGTRVDGNVVVGTGATLEALGAWVKGNIQAEDAAEVLTAEDTEVDGDIQVKRGKADITATTIGGNLQVEEEGASLTALENTITGDLQLKKAGSGDLSTNTVGGNIQLEENEGELSATDNDVFGDFQVFKNSGGVTLEGNEVEQSLQCKENAEPFVATGNVAGEKEGQCDRP